MNILLINHYAGSLLHGMEYRPFYLAREWAKLGHDVTIVGGSYSHIRTVQPEMSGGLMEENIDGVRYVWLKTPRYSGNGAQRVKSMFSFILKLRLRFKQILKDCPPSAVIASSTYPLDIFPARRIARQYGAKLIFEVHDLWPQTPIQIGGMSPRHPFIMLLQFAENYAYRHSDRVVSMLPNALGYMCEHGMAKEKYVHIPNGVCLSEWSGVGKPVPEQHAEFLRSLKASGKFIIGYVGGHQPSNSLSTLLDVADILRDSNVVFPLIGKGEEKERLQASAAERGLNNIVFLPPIPKEAVPNALADMDVLFIGWKKIPLYEHGISPNKLLDYMMAAKPIVHATNTKNDLVAASDCGITCPAEDSQAIADAILCLMKSPADELEAIGGRGKEYVIENHQYVHIAQSFLDIMQ